MEDHIEKYDTLTLSAPGSGFTVITLGGPQDHPLENGFGASGDPYLLKFICKDIKVRLPYQKLGLYLKIRQRFGDFNNIFNNQAFSENGRNSVVFYFFEVCYFPNTF